MSDSVRTVNVRYFAAARAAAAVDSDTLEASTVAELRTALAQRHGPAFARILPACGLLIDGTTSHDDLAALPNGATVDVLPPFAGG